MNNEIFENNASVCAELIAVCVFTFEHLPVQPNPLSQSMKHFNQNINTGSNLSYSKNLTVTCKYIKRLQKKQIMTCNTLAVTKLPVP